MARIEPGRGSIPVTGSDSFSVATDLSVLGSIKNPSGSLVLSASSGDTVVSGNLLIRGSGDLNIAGNLTVGGTTTTVSSSNLVVHDPLIVLAQSQSGAPQFDSGFVVERGTSENRAFIWRESDSRFAAVTTDETGSTAGNIVIKGYAPLKVLNLILHSGTVSADSTALILSSSESQIVVSGNLVVKSSTGNSFDGPTTLASVLTTNSSNGIIFGNVTGKLYNSVGHLLLSSSVGSIVTTSGSHVVTSASFIGGTDLNGVKLIATGVSGNLQITNGINGNAQVRAQIFQDLSNLIIMNGVSTAPAFQLVGNGKIHWSNATNNYNGSGFEVSLLNQRIFSALYPDARTGSLGLSSSLDGVSLGITGLKGHLILSSSDGSTVTVSGTSLTLQAGTSAGQLNIYGDGASNLQFRTAAAGFRGSVSHDSTRFQIFALGDGTNSKIRIHTNGTTIGNVDATERLSVSGNLDLIDQVSAKLYARNTDLVLSSSNGGIVLSGTVTIWGPQSSNLLLIGNNGSMSTPRITVTDNNEGSLAFTNGAVIALGQAGGLAWSNNISGNGGIKITRISQLGTGSIGLSSSLGPFTVGSVNGDLILSSSTKAIALSGVLVTSGSNPVIATFPNRVIFMQEGAELGSDTFTGCRIGFGLAGFNAGDTVMIANNDIRFQAGSTSYFIDDLTGSINCTTNHIILTSSAGTIRISGNLDLGLNDINFRGGNATGFQGNTANAITVQAGGQNILQWVASGMAMYRPVTSVSALDLILSSSTGAIAASGTFKFHQITSASLPAGSDNISGSVVWLTDLKFWAGYGPTGWVRIVTGSF